MENLVFKILGSRFNCNGANPAYHPLFAALGQKAVMCPNRTVGQFYCFLPSQCPDGENG